MSASPTLRRRLVTGALGLTLCLTATVGVPAQQWVTETRDPKQTQDEDFAKAYTEWTGEANYGSPLVDHLPKVAGIPSPKDVLGYHIGAPRKLTYYADILKYYEALAKATPRVKVETIGKSDEGRDLVVVWVSSDANIKNLQQNRDALAKLADPRGLPDAEIQNLINTTKPHYHFMGGLHSERSRSVRNVDGARLPARDRDVAVHLADSRQRVRLGHAGRRSGRTRSQRRSVLLQSGSAGRLRG